MIEPVALTLAYILDIAIGDPKQLPHPVRIMGWGIMRLEGFLSRFNIVQNGSKCSRNSHSLKLAGAILVLIIVGSTYGVFYVINLVLTSHFSLLAFLILVYLISTILATHELIKSAGAVFKSLNNNNIEDARKKLSLIVGRDTEPLDREAILKAALESLAESTSDGIIAPLFYFTIGGLPLAMAYKAVNTLDSMVGYKNEKYKDFGWAAARLDDIANHIPARITGFLIVISTFFIMIFKHPAHALRITHYALRIMFRDGRNHLSPNSGIPEAAMAGALGVRLGGPSFYGGIKVAKPYIGESRQSPELRAQSTDNLYLEASEKAITLTKITSLLGFIAALAFLYVRAGL